MTSLRVDGGWAWVILFTSFGGMLLTGSFMYSTGVIMAAMLEEIDGDLTRVSWITAIFSASMCASGPVVGFVTNRFGCRVAAIIGGMFCLVGLTGAYFTSTVYQLIPTYAVLNGIGNGFILCTSIVVSGFWFKKYRPIASGITVSGAGCGMFIGPPVVRLLIDAYALKGALLILGGIVSNFCVLGMLMRPSQTELDNIHKSKLNKTSSKTAIERQTIRTRLKSLGTSVKAYTSMFKNIPFLSYFFSNFAWCAGEMAALMHLPNYVERMGTSKMAAATLMTSMGVTSLASRLLTGFAASDRRIGPEILHIGLMGLIGLLTITFPLYSHTYETQVLYAAGYGLYSGGINTLVNPIAADLVNVENLASSFGLLAFIAGVGSLAGTPIAGMIVDYSGTYTYSYIYAGCMLLLGSLVATPIAFRKKNTSCENSKEGVEMEISVPELEPLKSDISQSICTSNLEQ